MNRTRNSQAGLTLLEVLAVVVILGMLAATLAVSFSGGFGKAKQEIARTAVGQLAQKLETYRVEKGQWPDPSIGLRALSIEHASPTDSFFLEEAQLVDPWGRAFLLVIPGPEGRPYEVLTYGADARPGGEGEDADVSSANLARS